MNRERGELQPNLDLNESASKFPHIEVELRWINRWQQDGLYRAHDDSEKPKYYVLDMLPYPSGEGLHVGHIEGYTATDIIARYKRMNGFEVIHPMGWDAFGLPTENYAIKTGNNPREVTTHNSNVFREQCIRAGLSFDWGREIDTSNEEYYRWTQEIFLKLFEKGLAYKAEAPVNWCTGCKTAIANEQVRVGHCERCDSQVESRNIEQWFYKITDYADRLLEDLNDLDWPESTKERQRNWIGRTEGNNIRFPLDGETENLTVFTTKPETLYGVSFIAIAPENPLLEKLVEDDQKELVREYTSRIVPQTQVERYKANREKTGVFTGKYAINPLTGDKVPIWVADYVLMDYGSGIVMGVPAHDERDRDFAKAHNLESTPVIREDEQYPGDLRKGTFLVGKYQRRRVEDSMNELFENLGDNSEKTVKYKLRDWLVSRERYWGAPIPIVHCETCRDQPVPEDQLPILLPELDDFTPTGVPPLAKSETFLHTTCPNCNEPAQRETKTLDTFVDSSWYFIRYADPHNNKEVASRELLEKWLPVDYYIGGADHSTGHLLYARFITKVLHDSGIVDFDEPFTKLRHIGMVLGEDRRKMSKRWGNVVNPDDVANDLGSDTLRLYEMFMGPLEQDKFWNTQAIKGSRRFIDRVWQLQQKVQAEQGSANEAEITNILIDNVTSAIESGKFNVAVSDFMKYLNFIDKNGVIGKQAYENLLKLLSPFTPFLTEELWHRTGNDSSIHESSWPTLTLKEKAERKTPILVMINGKVQGDFLPQEGLGDTKEEVLAILRADPRFANKLEHLQVNNIIYRPGRVINILS